MPVIGAYARLSGKVSGKVIRDEPLARHTTFRIGGPAALFIECESVPDVVAATAILAEEGVEWTVLGKGSNVLAADAGYDGAVLVLGRQFKRHSVENGIMTTGAGVALAALVQESFNKGLTGLEFAVGVPGTVGGALVMNAGTRDEWIGGIVDTVTLVEPGVGLVRLGGAEVEWGYRRTDLAKRGVVVEASLRLADGDTVDIRRAMEASLRRRKRTQPLGLPNAGSIFANPENDSAGRMIESLGLKGFKAGGAEVSEVHANFIVNTGGATAADVIEVARHVRSAVKDKYGIELRPEIRFLGSFVP